MFNQNGHLTDEALTALMDDQGWTVANPQARAHASECSLCQSRQSQFQQALTQFAELYSSTSDPIATSSLQGRAELAARLASAQQQPRPWLGLSTPLRRLQVVAAIAAISVIALFRPHSFTHHRYTSAEAALRLLPDRALTPGATRAVNLTDVCSSLDQNLDPAVSDPIKRVVFQEYGVNGAKTGDYQVDYLINPQLGGTADVRNLWPEPYGFTTWNAHAKDALEDRLHQMVCNNQIDLMVAQQEIATNWIAAYQKYFHVKSPT